MSLPDKANKLSAYLQVVRGKLHSVEKYNPTTSGFLSVQESHVLLGIGTMGPQTMSEIAHGLQLSLSSVTALVDKLERKKFVARARSLQDRRIVRAELTKEGRKFYDLVEDAHRKLSVSLLKTLTLAEQNTLLELFRKITVKLSQSEKKKKR